MFRAALDRQTGRSAGASSRRPLQRSSPTEGGV